MRKLWCPDGVELIFDVGEPRHNNANHKMLIDSPQLAQQETEIAFKNIALLSRCGGLIGQTNAHFATLAASSIVARTGRCDRIKLIDVHIAEKRSRNIFIYFSIKRKIRALLRRIFPWLTARSRMARN